MFINYSTQKYMESFTNGALASGTIGYLSAWAVKAVVPGIVSPINAAVYSVSCYALQKLDARSLAHDDRSKIFAYTVCSIAALGVCHLVGNPISIAAALALTGVSLVWNKVCSGKLS